MKKQEQGLNMSPDDFDSVHPKMLPEPNAYKRACIRMGMIAALESLRKHYVLNDRVGYEAIFEIDRRLYNVKKPLTGDPESGI